MKSLSKLLFLLLPALMFAQNVRVDSQTYTPQQLVEDILINSTCINNVIVTNIVGGNFGGNDTSYGYFEANGSNFPFQSGIVLSTGKIANAEGPNTSLSDDDAPGWIGDTDLENVLNEPNTLNATILEFDFTSQASQISFRYLFASEEYQENDDNTCQYSDLFGFLIRPVTETQYTNIALVPDTQTPVKVTTVHSGIQGGCPPINEFYFEGWNGPSAPINFNGQTKVLTATANVTPNTTYHVKLVIADEQNYRYDSAVFLEAGSFQISTDLGPNLLSSTGNALCDEETYTLDASQPNVSAYKWFKDNVELIGETNPTLTVNEAGTYEVEVTLSNGCVSYGDVVIEFYPAVVVTDATLTECDQNQDGITFYDLYDASNSITNSNQSLFITNFFFTQNNAIQNTGNIINPNDFQNTTPNQIVFARVENQAGCFEIAQLQLVISSNVVTIAPQTACDDAPTDGFTDFNLNDITASIQSQIPADAVVRYYLTEADAFSNNNALSSPYRNTTQNTQTLFVKILSNNQCYAVTTVTLNVLYTPTLADDETVIYCTDSFPNTVRILGGVRNDSASNYYYEWLFNGTSTGVNTSFFDANEIGTYTVIVTDPNGCSATRNITVTASEAATIEDIIVQEGGSNNTVTVIVSGNGEYEYALDNPNGFYQDSNTFTNVAPGIHTVYVRNQDECGIVEQEIAVLGFPKFFTPNGDTQNETWQVYGVKARFNQGIDIKIFNRYGKILAQFNHLSPGWDGTHKSRPMPSDDYWFVATLPDGRTYRGHFALVR
ncbi:T9SS type B sorting domain-containing protein [Subsaxibacter sp. CAU 1640]|uniref:T9SS type B sorting domain-containing protein n=1 Tax=Subsaxibacter sp. CAU 1640 TaxID=2933271 RepID=UPI002004C0A0|nr:choice-of-anchor L domain-containing protein [Subsaxibacter sp. CAU 1640]MCK7591571.1 T9SS type B sorting domain-containing protein [Subsaxibacter sp. CAU 1640]